MYQRGDRVLVKGFGGRTAVLRVVESRRRGLLLCSEDRFRRMSQGEDLEPVAVGFPYTDVLGPASDTASEGEDAPAE